MSIFTNFLRLPKILIDISPDALPPDAMILFKVASTYDLNYNLGDKSNNNNNM